MEYSIITTSDKGYFPFLEILVNSVIEVCDVEFIKNFIIVDTGLEDYQKNNLTNKFSKITFINTDINTNFEGGIWGDDWRKNVKSKTVTLYETLLNINHPLLMLDADIRVVKDLKDLVKLGGDVQVCVRSNHAVKYIGSFFFIINPDKCKEFVKYWRDLTNSSNEKKAMESPSLVKAVEKFKNKIKIKELSEELVNVVSKDLLTGNSFIIHFKSKALHKTIEETLEKRIWDNV